MSKAKDKPNRLYFNGLCVCVYDDNATPIHGRHVRDVPAAIRPNTKWLSVDSPHGCVCLLCQTIKTVLIVVAVYSRELSEWHKMNVRRATDGKGDPGHTL